MAIPIRREIEQSPVDQGVREVIVYTLDTTPWGGAPASPEITVTDITELDVDTDVTSEVMPTNNPQLDENIIILSPLRDLTLGNRYRVDMVWQSSGSTFNSYGIINATK